MAEEAVERNTFDIKNLLCPLDQAQDALLTLSGVVINILDVRLADRIVNTIQMVIPVLRSGYRSVFPEPVEVKF